ncbi:MAG: hypothetical protein IJY47_02040 [Clostridia bacterium]|nr:hypothetical protein [Clostridia bacterium]
MTQREQESFRQICEEEKNAPACSAGVRIGTYGEKRLHRVLKKWICSDETYHERPVGRYIADLLVGDEILEIQTGSLHPLREKLKGYLETTDYRITVIYPMFAEKRLVRMDRETGEVLSVRRSPKRAQWRDALPELFWIREVLESPRVTIRLLLLSGEERRYSERMRYRREGAYDSELFPEELLDELTISVPSDYRMFLPSGLTSFTAPEYGAFSKQKGRDLYSSLNLLCSLGLLRREAEGRRYRYTVVKEMIENT